MQPHRQQSGRSLTRERRRPGRVLQLSGGPHYTLDEFARLNSPTGEATLEVDGISVRLTRLERTYWPGEGITKFEILRYYIRVWPAMRTFLVGRPAILQRYPRGVEAPMFFQHDLDNVPDFVQTVKLVSVDGREIDYAVYDSLASLLYLTNLGTLEHHPWHSRVDDLDHPDWLALDLDPGSAPWEAVLQIARSARAVFRRRRLKAFAKTSGSRGIHFYLPLAASTSYAQSAGAAHELAQEIESASPNLATVERNVSEREGRVYVDWLQNARGKTMAAPLSARARPGATVSAPLSWRQIEAGVRISDFTVRNLGPGAARAWSGFFDHRQSL